MQPEHITNLRRHWADATPPADLADRIIAHALEHKQHRPFMARMRDAFAMPQQSFAMKGLAFAACVMVAVIALEEPGKTTTKPKALKYSMPMEQIVEDMLWNDYSY